MQVIQVERAADSREYNAKIVRGYKKLTSWMEIFKLRQQTARAVKAAQASNGGLLTPAEAAEYLGVSPLTIYGWTSKKKMPFRKVGRLLRFDKKELDAWTQTSYEAAKKDNEAAL